MKQQESKCTTILLILRDLTLKVLLDYSFQKLTKKHNLQQTKD